MKISSYEQIVNNILVQNNITFKREQSFFGLKGFHGKPLRYDFTVYNKDNTIDFFIEVQGIQHYKEVSAWGGKRGLQKRQEYDRKKISYALANNIPLICLPYWDIDEKLTYNQIITNPKYRAKSIWHNNRINVEGKE